MGIAKGNRAGFSQDMSPVVLVSLSSLSIRSINGMFCLWGCLATVLPLRAADSPPTRTSEQWVGYTQLATREAGGRHANIRTSKAMLMHTDGSTPRELGAQLIENNDSWTQFAGWSPDGRKALIQVGWQDPVNAQWEEEHRTFHMRPDTWKLDTWVLVLKDGSLHNPCAVDRVSHYNAASFTPDGRHLIMTSRMEGVSQPFLMRIDGTQNAIFPAKNRVLLMVSTPHRMVSGFAITRIIKFT